MVCGDPFFGFVYGMPRTIDTGVEEPQIREVRGQVALTTSDVKQFLTVRTRAILQKKRADFADILPAMIGAVGPEFDTLFIQTPVVIVVSMVVSHSLINRT